MKKNVLLFITFVSATGALYSQDMISQRGTITISPSFQSWRFDEATPDFSEFSAPVTVYYPAARNLSFSLRANPAAVSPGGDNLADLNGIADTQISTAYYLPAANMVFNLGANIPTGKRELALDEFSTSTLISNNIFNLKTPNFGQGLNISAGGTWAVPVSATMVFGMGGAYHFRGGFKPIEGFVENYKPGDEILLTGGVDFQLGKTTNLTADVVVTIYGTDKIGDTEVFSAGTKIAGMVQFRKQIGFNEFQLFGRYRTRGKSESAVILGQALSEAPQTFPDQVEILAGYKFRLADKFYLGVDAQARIYGKSDAFFSGITLFGGGLSPELILSRSLRLPLTLKFFTGSIDQIGLLNARADGPNLTGIEIGAGLSLIY